MGYLNLVGSFVYKEPLFVAKLAALAENDAQLQSDGWAQNTKGLFFQASVPTGWTQDTSQNDKALRVVGPTGGGGSGGTTPLSSTVSLNHTHTLATDLDGAHTHTFTDHTHACGPTNNSSFRGFTNVIADNGGFMTLYGNSGGSANITQLTGTLASPGALTLSTQAAHTHGTPSSFGVNFVFAYCDVIIGTKNAPGGTYTDLTSAWTTGDIINFDPFVSSADNDAYNLGNLMPVGTVMIFGQTAAPVGWTKISSVDDRALRIVSGTGGGTGGTQPLSSGVNLNHGHTIASVAAHTHTVPNHQHSLDTDGSISGAVIAASGYGNIQESGVGFGVLVQSKQAVGSLSSATVYKSSTPSGAGGFTTGSADAHTHQIVNSLADFTLAYLDVIQCSKNSSGAPYSYVDYTSEFAWKKLVSYQRLNQLAANDAYIEYHTTPSGSQALFFMASPPAGWLKITSVDDHALRIVMGGTGGSVGGGSQLSSAGISLGHTHSIVADPDHTHDVTHTHVLDSGTANVSPPDAAIIMFGGRLVAANVFGSAGAVLGLNKTSLTNTETMDPAGNHAHGGVTNNQLTDIALAYADVIWCSKS